MTRTTMWCFAILVLLSGPAGCGTAEPGEASAAVSDEALTHSCPSLPSEVEARIRGRGRAALDRLYTLDHYVPVGRHRWIHLRETFNIRAFLRRDQRAVLMLPGPLTNGEVFQLDADGYRGRDIIANEDAFAFTADYEGTGESSVPADGRSPGIETQIEAMRIVVRYINLIRGVSRVDILGESWGGGVASELCADRRRVRSCVLASLFYEETSPFATAAFRSPEWRAFLDSLPDGYLPTSAPVYGLLTAPMLPEVAASFLETQPGIYPTAPLYDVFELPYFDPSLARVPGRLITGQFDPNQPLSDSEALVEDWGGPMDLVVVEGGGHIPRVEEASREVYWDAVLDFYDL